MTTILDHRLAELPQEIFDAIRAAVLDEIAPLCRAHLVERVERRGAPVAIRASHPLASVLCVARNVAVVYGDARAMFAPSRPPLQVREGTRWAILNNTPWFPQLPESLERLALTDTVVCEMPQGVARLEVSGASMMPGLHEGLVHVRLHGVSRIPRLPLSLVTLELSDVPVVRIRDGQLPPALTRLSIVNCRLLLAIPEPLPEGLQSLEVRGSVLAARMRGPLPTGLVDVRVHPPSLLPPAEK